MLSLSLLSLSFYQMFTYSLRDLIVKKVDQILSLMSTTLTLEIELSTLRRRTHELYWQLTNFLQISTNCMQLC